MKPFKSLLGVVPRGARTVREVSIASVSVKKTYRASLSTSDKLKLAKVAREGGENKFTFFETDGKSGSDFCAVYDLHMRLDALGKAITFFDMDDVFNTIPYETVKMLEMKLKDLLNAQVLVETAADSVATNPIDSTLKLAVVDLVAERQSVEEVLERVAIEPLDLLKNYKGLMRRLYEYPTDTTRGLERNIRWRISHGFPIGYSRRTKNP